MLTSSKKARVKYRFGSICAPEWSRNPRRYSSSRTVRPFPSARRPANERHPSLHVRPRCARGAHRDQCRHSVVRVRPKAKPAAAEPVRPDHYRRAGRRRRLTAAYAKRRCSSQSSLAATDRSFLSWSVRADGKAHGRTRFGTLLQGALPGFSNPLPAPPSLAAIFQNTPQKVAATGTISLASRRHSRDEWSCKGTA